MKESLKCKLEYIENKSIELEKIELFNNAEEIRKKEYLKFFEGERKRIESENIKNKKELEEFKNKIEEKRNYFRKPILIISAICVGITLYGLFKINSVSNLINEHEKKLTYKGALEKAKVKDQPIVYGSMNEPLKQGDIEITVTNVLRESMSTNKDKVKVSITLENLSDEDLEINSDMFKIVGDSGRADSNSSSIFNKNIDRIVNIGRKEHFVYGAVVKKNDKNLELEFGRGVIKLN
ncbi:DUF4352 domain-containing protein [Clostridium perfringens]|uniref:DUF4352 domain-containing protein n=1 Tax=Clostridium perfringens TaxID=1502 RepID=UPI003A100263